jgi:hypothetical protein
MASGVQQILAARLRRYRFYPRDNDDTHDVVVVDGVCNVVGVRVPL